MFKWFSNILLIILFACGFCGKSVNATDIEHVNIGRIAVDDQSIRSQQKAGKSALRQVFIKISGNQNIVQTPEIGRAINNYEQYLIASSFIQVNKELVFEAIFSRSKVEQLLLASGQSVWTSLRPNGLLWVVNENEDGSKTMLSHNSGSALIPIVEKSAFARGVDVILPLGDIQDASQVSLYDLWNQHLGKIINQSQRYVPDFIISSTIQAYTYAEHQERQALEREFKDREADSTKLEQKQLDVSPDDVSTIVINDLVESTELTNVGQSDNPADIDHIPRLLTTEVPIDTAFKLDYIITNMANVERGVIYASEREEAIMKLIDSYANILADEFALGANSSAEKTNTLIQVNNISSLVDYLSLIELLNSVPSVSATKLQRLVGNKAQISVEHAMNIQQLAAILALDTRTKIEANIEKQNPDKDFISTEELPALPELRINWQ